ncbi:MAG: DUF6076 domain-containing protein [Clostridia bacterium]
MAQFFKDLFHSNNGFFEFDVLFGNSDIKIKENSYSYGQLVVELLNFDFTEFKQIMSENSTFEQKKKVALTLPVYRDFYYEDVSSFVEKFKDEEFIEMFSGNKIIEDDFDKILESITFIEKYRWFLDEVNYRKEKNFIHQINMNGFAAFVSDKTLRSTNEWEATMSKIQYTLVEDENGNSQIFEQITFNNLIDFFYTDFYKGIMRESVPKKCRLCGKYFLQEKGFTYEYCNNIYEDNKTCRDVGSTKSFKEKTANNEIWKIHQRAYKKYYARIAKKNMTQKDFLDWASKAEEIRDNNLPIYEKAMVHGEDFDLAEYTKQINYIK